MSKLYAGIGSRETPPDVLELMTALAKTLREEGWTLRSGHAMGADWAFEQGAEKDSLIYLPWKDFGTKPYKNDPGRPILGHPICDDDAAEEGYAYLVRLGIRNPDNRDSMRRLHGRNVAQVMGLPGEKLSSMVVCWCPIELGIPTGGTATAIKLAEHHKIPVFNLIDPAIRKRIERKIEAYEPGSCTDCGENFIGTHSCPGRPS